MKKAFLLALLSIFVVSLQAQTPYRDSIVQIAKEDARHFKLNSADFAEFRRAKLSSSNAPYFKPTKANVRDTTLLNNPDYVDAFSQTAYLKTTKRHTAGHYVLLGVGAYLAIGVITLFVLLAKATK